MANTVWSGNQNLEAQPILFLEWFKLLADINYSFILGGQKSSEITFRLGKTSFSWPRNQFIFAYWCWTKQGINQYEKVPNIFMHFHVSYLITLIVILGVKEPAFCGQVYRDCPAHIPRILGIWVWIKLHGSNWFHRYVLHHCGKSYNLSGRICNVVVIHIHTERNDQEYYILLPQSPSCTLI